MKTSTLYIPDHVRMLGQPSIDMDKLLARACVLLVNCPDTVSEEKEGAIFEVAAQLAFLRGRLAHGRPL